MSRSWLPFWSVVLGVVFAGSLLAQSQKVQRTTIVKDGLRENFSQRDYEEYLKKVQSGQIPSQAGPVRTPNQVSSPSLAPDVLVNNNSGASGTQGFTQSEASLVAFGNTVVIGFNDAGSYNGSNNQFTGWSYSTNGGASFTDGGTLPVSTVGDAGDPVLARHDATGRIYLSTLGFTSPGTIQMWRSDNGGVSWLAPTNATPGGNSEDKQWHTVDNFAGAGNGNVYMVSRRFAGSPLGVNFYRSTDAGATFTPNVGVPIVSANQGAFVAVGPDHSVYVFWYNGTTIQMRKSTDQGVTFAPAVVVSSGLVGGTNGDLGLTGIRQGTTTASSFRSSEFPHVAVNPISGHIYVTHANDGVGVDKADVFMVMSTDGGSTWSTATKINDDATTTDQWQPTIAVTPFGNQVGIFYYSRQEDAANNLFKYYGRIGNISGSTISWQPSFAISDVASLPEFGRDAFINSVYMGDYNHAVATQNAFHVIWSDNRDDLAGGAPRKDPNMYYEAIPTTFSYGWAKGVTVSTVGAAIVSGVELDITDASPFAGAISAANGSFKVGARVDSPATTRNVTIRGRKFGYIDTTRVVTITRNDTINLGNFAIRPAPGGTLSVQSRHAGGNLRSYVEVKFGGTTVVSDSTNAATGLLTAPLPVGTYSMRVDAPPPYRTLNYPTVNITAGGTTNIDALTSPVFTFNPTVMRDTLAVGGSRAKNMVITNTTPDTVRFRITDDNASLRRFREIVPEPAIQEKAKEMPKGYMGPSNPPQIDGRGGPDAFGYSWIDSDEPPGPGVPTFNWVDISNRDTIPGTWSTTRDDGFKTLTLPWSFPFYGNTYTSINVVTNGFMNFGTTSTAFTNGAIPSTATPNNAIYPMWDDMDLRNSGQVYYWNDVANGRLIIQYDKVPRYVATPPATDTVTFQVHLRPNGEILIQYLRLVGTTNSATVGVENAAGTVALQIAFDQTYLHNNLAVRIFLPDATWLTPAPTVGSIVPNGTQNIQVTFDATGLTAGSQYNANMFVEATHPDVTRPFTVPSSLNVQTAGTALLVLNKSTITFPNTVIGNIRRDTIVARNQGATALNITSISTNNTRFTVSPSSATLPNNGDSIRVIVTYTPIVPAGTDTGRVNFVSNSSSGSPIPVTLRGTAVGAPILLARVDSLVRPAMTANTRDSIRFFVRNNGTLNANYQARAVLFPRTAAEFVGPTQPLIIPLTVESQQYPPPTSMADLGTASYIRPLDNPSQTNPLDAVGLRAFGISVAQTIGGTILADSSLKKIDLDLPGTLTNVAFSRVIFAGDFDNASGTLWGILRSPVQGLARIDTNTGAVTLVGATASGSGETFSALKVDPTNGTLYGVSTSATSSTLFTINPTTGASTLVGSMARPFVIAMSVNNSGQMYCYTLSDSFYSVNKATGAVTGIGPIGFDANFAQDMDFDPITGTCYLAAFNNATGVQRGELRTVNLATGATTLIGPFQNSAEIDVFGIKGQGVAPWLSVVPSTGTIAINDSVQLTARFDATDPSIFNNPGNYLGRVEVNATNATADTLKIPARMFVVPGVNPDLVVTPDSVDFGVVALNQTDSSRTVLLRNIGGSALNITNITSSNPVFSPSVTSRTIASLDTFRLRLRFASSAPAGVKLGTLSFVCNDPTPPTLRMRGVAQGQANIVVTPDTFTFARSVPDTFRTSFRIRNSGTDTLRFTINEALTSAANDASIARSMEQQAVPNIPKGGVDPTPGQLSPNGRGGPDAFGYTWIDSDEPGGPTFSWVDISTTGTPVTTWTSGTADDGYFTTTLPWAFPFYGTDYTSINLGTNGFANFGTGSTSFSNTAIPTTATPNNALYVNWDDFDLSASGTLYYRNDAANGRFIVQWNNVPHYSQGTPVELDTMTFQIILQPSGDILYQYLRKATAESTATVGIENSGGTIGLQTSFNRRYVKPNLAVRITKDLLPWTSVDRTTGTVLAGDSTTISLRVHPPITLPSGVYRGRYAISGNTPATGLVRMRLDWTPVLTPAITLTSPNGGELWNIGSTYPITWNATSVDTVTIGYSTTGRTGPYTTITAGVPAGPVTRIHPKALARPIEGGTYDDPNGTFNWLVPNTPSTNAFVRIVRKSTGTPGDTSDAAFTIRTAPIVLDTGWVAQTSGTTLGLYTVKAVDANVAWAGGGSGTGASGIVIRTTNGGTTWATVGTFPADVYTITALDANFACAANYTSTYTRLVRTTNGGASWQTVDSIAGGFYDYVHMFNATTGYAMGDPVGGNWVLKRTTNGGATWTTAATLAGTDAGWNNSMMWLDANNGWFGSNSSKVYRTTNGGTTWTSGATSFVNSYAVGFAALNTGLTGADTGPFNKSTDGGASWTTGPAALTAAVLGMWANPGSQEFWVTNGNSIYYTSNFGTSWSLAAKNGYTSTAQQNHVNMYKSGLNLYGWTVGNSGTIARYRRIATGVESNVAQIPGVYALDQNFPNPFNPTTNIRFALPEQANVSLKVYNVLGQEVVTLAQGDMPAAFHNVVWNGTNSSGSQVATGLYFYRIEATGVSGEKFNSLKKLILLK